MALSSKGTALITGASSGIGAVYADRLARQGYDLILVARSQAKLNALANHLSNETGRVVEVVAADLKDKADVLRVEAILRSDARITLLVNNAGVGAVMPLLASPVDDMEGIRIQAVLPGATATDFWSEAGNPVENLPQEIVMSAEDMVDAALVGLASGEVVTLPGLHDGDQWDAYEVQRQALSGLFGNSTAAPRYR
ncbi:SDR family NAD(P)-dependent oxidoreductase [Pseudomonas sp. AL03]|uniref:SDR family NAD(P)-dependent oxidoreductase n=1 Tax=Pseudomonas sp. AL03 TaxID=3042230 RepID=UPI00249BCE31|nr:SDR family NAD(P)-dependent oxidoreductase [Pseudomonas sp. AL03]MDI3273380.1 SDR family NAD(P)-dependent oxidoreductase [Pseudomonas sp. AL03]